MINSNIRGVIDRLERANRALPQQIQSVMQSENYAGQLRYIAGTTMEDSGILEDDERRFVPKLVDTFMHATLAGHMEFSIQMLPISTLIEDIQSEEDFLKFIPRQALVDWVANYKEKKGRDFYSGGQARSDETIATRVAFAIQTNPEPWIHSTDPTGLRMVTGLTHLSPEKVSALLKAVLHAWVEFMRDTVPALLKAKIHSTFQ